MGPQNRKSLARSADADRIKKEEGKRQKQERISNFLLLPFAFFLSYLFYTPLCELHPL